jgi:bifunctional DNA-binding transcriptional regulator/antitoxin component of YhaV-PrlF toxin-antitoxin module
VVRVPVDCQVHAAREVDLGRPTAGKGFGAVKGIAAVVLEPIGNAVHRCRSRRRRRSRRSPQGSVARTRHPVWQQQSIVAPETVPCHTESTMTRHNATEIRVGPQGRVVIPVELRRALGLEPGEVLVGRVEHERLVLERRATILGRLQARFKRVVPDGVILSEELLADRRQASRRESETA